MHHPFLLVVVILGFLLQSSSGWTLKPLSSLQKAAIRRTVAIPALIVALSSTVPAVHAATDSNVVSQGGIIKETIESEVSVVPVRVNTNTVRLVDLGGNRGARGLASNGVQGGSLVDQLKAYGGPGAVVREDNSLKNPFKTSNTNAGIGAQLQLYQSLNGGK